MDDHGSGKERPDPDHLALRFKEVFGLSVSEASAIVYREALRQRRGNTDDAQDLAQAVWERIVGQLRLNEATQVHLVTAWLRQAVRSVAIDEYRRTNAQKRTPVGLVRSLDDMTEAEEPQMVAPGPDEVVARRDLIARLRRAVDELPADQRAVVMLVMNGFTFAEIADELSLPIGTAKTRFRSAVKNLRGLEGLDEH